MTLTTLTMERAHDAAMDRDTTLPERPVRRSFSAAYKLATLTEYEAASGASTSLLTGARGSSWIACLAGSPAVGTSRWNRPVA